MATESFTLEPQAAPEFAAGSTVIAKIHEQYPQYAEVPDDHLAIRIGERYPQYLEQPDFAADVAKAKGRQIAAAALQPARTSEELAARNHYANVQRFGGVGNDPSMTTTTGGELITRPVVELAGRVTPQIVADAVDTVKAEFQTMRANAQSAMTPEEYAAERQRNLETRSRKPGTAEQVASGVQNVVGGAVNSMVSPIGLAMLPLMAGPAPLAKLATAGFLADTARHLPEAVDQAAEAAYQGDAFRKTEAFGNLAMLGAMSMMMGKHLASPGPKGEVIHELSRQLARGDFEGRPLPEPGSTVEFMDPAQAEGRRMPADWTVPRQPAGGRAKAPAETVAKSQTINSRPVDSSLIVEEPLSPPPVENPSASAAPTRPELRPAAGETITAAAVQSADGGIYTGKWHPAAYDEWIKATGRTRDEAVAALQRGELVDGFLTSEGRFVTREEAATIASAARQFKPDKEGDVAYAGGLKDLGKGPGKIEPKQTAGPAGPAVTTPTGVNPDTGVVTLKATAPSAPVKPFEVVSSSKSYHTIRLPDGSDVTVKARTAADARVKAEQDWTKAQEPPKPRKTANRAVVGDILDEIEQAGGLMSKTRARDQGLLTEAKNGPEYNDVPGLASPEHNFIYGNGRGGKGSLTPDKMLEALSSNPKYADMSVPEMWAAIDAASKGRMRQRSAEAQGMRQMKEEAKQATAFEKAQSKEAETDPLGYLVASLEVGAELTIGGEKVKVAGFDPETGDLILDDGAKFGRQRVNAQEFVYAEKIKPPEQIGIPKLGAMEKGTGDLLKGQTEDFALSGEKGTDAMRLEAERTAAAKRAAEDKAIQDFEQGSLLGSPSQQQASPPSPMGAPAPGTGVFGNRMGVSLAEMTAKRVSIPQIMDAFEAVVESIGGTSPLRTGRILPQRRASGIYDPQQQIARIRSADNIPTAAHEIAHASQHMLFGDPSSKGLRSLPADVRKELITLGQALYGSRKPVGGYVSEGWAEFMRLWLTTDEAAVKAPKMAALFETQILANNPAFAKSMGAARQMVETYQQQGSMARARMQMVDAPGRLAQIRKEVSKFFSKENMVEEFDALEKLSQMAAEKRGAKLSPADDPFLLATWKRGTAGSVVETMVERGMVDIHGNITGPPLRDALAPVKRQYENFLLYLFGRRAMERWSKGKNPGLQPVDAAYLVNQLGTPEFQLAAANYYKWNDGLLDYLEQSDPSLGPLMKAIRAESSDYAPLARVFEADEVKPLLSKMQASGGSSSNPMMRMGGSGRQVRNIMEATLENAARMVSRAHKNMVLQSVVRLAKEPGMGFLVEEVPRSMVKNQMNVEGIRAELEKMGVDTTSIPEDTVLSYFSIAPQPKGVDPIVAVRDVSGQAHWFHVPPKVFEILNGLDPVKLPPVLDLVLGVPTRAFRLGTTGLRPSFSLLTNPLRDIQSFIAQSMATSNPAKLAAAYFSGMKSELMHGLGAKPDAYSEAFRQLGAHMGQPLGLDINYTKHVSKGLFHGKIMKVVTNPVDHLREVLSLPEAAPRVAELKLMAEKVGWKPGTPMTPDQAVQMAVAAKRVTTDFSASGRTSRVINQAVPFYNANIQGTRTFLRTLKTNPARAILFGLSAFTLPTLALWNANKDKEWFRNLPWRERYLYWNIEDQGKVYQIPRAPEWGNLFATLPEAMFDSWHRQDPAGAKAAVEHVLATQNPVDYPVLLKVAKEQWQNRIDFFDRPIVPRNQTDLPAGEQFGPYTTKLAKALGQAFPETISPRRLDAMLRGVTGGLGPDILEAVGLGSQGSGRAAEPSDLPVFGRLYRRGGEFTAASQPLADFYDTYNEYATRVRSKARPADPGTTAYWMRLEATHQIIKLAHQAADNTTNIVARASLYRNMANWSREALAGKPKPAAK